MSLDDPTNGNSSPDTATSKRDGRGYWFELVDLDPAAEFLDIPPRTLREFRWKGGGPPFVEVNKKLKKYRRVDLRDWSAQRRRTSTSETA